MSVIATDATSAVDAFGETMYDPGEGGGVVAIAERIAWRATSVAHPRG
jgi:hypothetical protein